MQQIKSVETIFHAFHWRFDEILPRLDEIASLGFTSIQLSPAQKSFVGPDGQTEWFHRYQPWDYSSIEGLGSHDDLRALCEAAAARDLTIIADVVFNHMGSIIGGDEAAALWAACGKGGAAARRAHAEIASKLDGFPQFDHTDFHVFRPIDGPDYDDDALRCTGWGGAGTWPDLCPSPRVLAAQREHLEALHACGVRGFRFDAVKQMFAKEQYQPLVEHGRSLAGVRFIYGEVLSTSRELHAEYAPYALTTDFLLLQELVSAFETTGDLRRLLQRKPLGLPAVVFARNHDTVMQDLPTLSFASKRRAALANVFLLTTQSAPALLLAEDLEDPELSAPTRAALAMRSEWLNRGPAPASSDGHASEALPSPELSLAHSPKGHALVSCLWVTWSNGRGLCLNASHEAVDVMTVPRSGGLGSRVVRVAPETALFL